MRTNRGKLHFASALTILWQRSSAILTRISFSLLCTAWRWTPLKHVFCKKKKKRKKEKRHHGGNLKQLCNWRPRAPPNYLIPCGILIADLRINFCRKSRIPPFFSIAFPNSSFVSKSKDKKTNKAHYSLIWKETTLNVRLVDSHLPLKRIFPDFPTFRQKKIPLPVLKFWRIPCLAAVKSVSRISV